MLYLLAHRTWQISKWIWLTIIVPITIGLIINIGFSKGEDIPGKLRSSLIGQFIFSDVFRLLTLIFLGLLALITLFSRLIMLLEERARAEAVLQRYLRLVVQSHQHLNANGLRPQKQPLITANVPLPEVFVSLQVVSDRPAYDLPGEQQKLLEELEKREKLPPAEQNARLQQLRTYWRSEIGPEASEAWQKQHVMVEEIIPRLTASSPVAILLGSPGAGKTTTLQALTLQAAQTALVASTTISTRQISKQLLPILLHVRDYVRRLGEQPDLTLEQFLKDQYLKVHPRVPVLLQESLTQGHCLLLFDGLDEIADPGLRRQVSETIRAFIAFYSADKANTPDFNRFVIASRIVGYEARTFAAYEHYTLLDLNSEQIGQFLNNWCPALERYQIRQAQGMSMLRPEQQAQVIQSGHEQRDRFLKACQQAPGIRRLAINPLLLTTLILLQRGGRNLAHRRSELYQLITHALLDNWQQVAQGTESRNELPLVEAVLGELAYRLHNSDLVLPNRGARALTREAIARFHGHPLEEVSEHSAQEFLEKLRTVTSLFIESEPDRLCFAHRTFREYYVALYLLRKSPEELLTFVREQYREAIWREPLLLVVAILSGQESIKQREQASEIMRAISATGNEYDLILQRNFLFAATMLVDCDPWNIDPTLQYLLANQLFERYGDVLGVGRYTKLQQEIEQIALNWLRGQQTSSKAGSTFPALLAAWRDALSDPEQPVHQEGATHLLAVLGASLPDCGQEVMMTLVPPLMQLAHLEALPWPTEFTSWFPEPAVRAASPQVEDYACAALRLLDSSGPAGWLHSAWKHWHDQEPSLLERLTGHALEINMLLTPATIPSQSTNPNWQAQLEIVSQWRACGASDPRGLQLQLLQASNTARYPQAFLLKHLLARELAEETLPEQPRWYQQWEAFLKARMARGECATYQACLSLRALLSQANEAQQAQINADLLETLETVGPAQVQLLYTLTNIYLQNTRQRSNLRPLRHLEYLRYLRYLQYPGYLRYLQSLQQYQEILHEQAYQAPEQLQDQIYAHYLHATRLIQDIQNTQEYQDLQDLQALYCLLERPTLIRKLCTQLTSQAQGAPPAMLLALYSIAASYQSIPKDLSGEIEESIHSFKEQLRPGTVEQQLLIKALLTLVENPLEATVPIASLATLETADARVTSLGHLQAGQRLEEKQLQQILIGCTDNSRLSAEKQRTVGVGSVSEYAWQLLTRRFSLSNETQELVQRSLESKDPLTCAAMAILLQNGCNLPQAIRLRSARKLLVLLSNVISSCRPLDPPDQSRIWHLDDVLFEALAALAN